MGRHPEFAKSIWLFHSFVDGKVFDLVQVLVGDSTPIQD
jgi:hypothetical protein